jgi:hypothetical protein
LYFVFVFSGFNPAIHYLEAMKRIAILALAAFIGLACLAQSVAGPLDRLSGKKNVVLLFSKSRSEAELDRQLSLFSERRSELEDRDTVVLLTVKGRDTMAVFGYASVSAGTGRQLVGLYKPVGSGLTVVLVDKNGTEKGRWPGTVDPQIIFDLIDTMPAGQAATGAATGG